MVYRRFENRDAFIFEGPDTPGARFGILNFWAEGSTIVWGVGNHSSSDTVSHPGRLHFCSSKSQYKFSYLSAETEKGVGTVHTVDILVSAWERTVYCAVFTARFSIKNTTILN